ncbi:MAG: TIGR01459 family HAD-type hydrolase [Pseudomonadota bacterium]
MTRDIASLADIAGGYDAIVLDQWGVLHDGTTPYPGAVAALETLRARGHRLAVLSNSGKRAAPNAARITDMGFAEGMFEIVMTSGEALWRDLRDGAIVERRFFPIERAPGDAAAWAEGLNIVLGDLDSAEAVLLMGLPDGSALPDWAETMHAAQAHGLPVYCSNPDRHSPRAGGLVVSPGALAFDYADRGGRVRFYGKPHVPVFEALERHLKAQRILMVGDSLEHDIAGAQAAGWDSVLVRGGLYAQRFAAGPVTDVLDQLVAAHGCARPTFTMGQLQ